MQMRYNIKLCDVYGLN